jgi:hypothetical protein
MKPSTLLSEVTRNLSTGTTRALLAASVMAAALLGVGMTDLSATAVQIDEVRRFIAAGGSTWTITSANNIDPAICERLPSTGVIEASGALRSTSPVTFTVLPGGPMPAYDATRGLLDLIAPTRSQPNAAGIYLSPDAAQALTPDAGPRAQAVPPAVVLGGFGWPDDGRPSVLQYAALGAAPATGSWDQCWARGATPTDDPGSLLRSVLIRPPVDATDGVVAQLNPTLGERLASVEDFRTRPTRWAWIAAVLVGGGIGAVVTALRRVELADASELGIDARTALTGITLETMPWAVAGATLALPVILLYAHSSAPTDQGAVAALGIRVLVAGVVGACAGSAAITLWARRRGVDALLRLR